MLCFPSVKNRKRNQNNFRQLYKTPNFVAKTDKNKKFRTHFMQFRATHSVIARSNATWQSPGRDTSLQTPRKILLYLRGEKGANKHKSERYRPR